MAPFAETFLPTIPSTRLAKVILNYGVYSRRVVLREENASLDVMEKQLCSLAKRFNGAHPGRKMEVEIAGIFGRLSRRIYALSVLNDATFMPALKEEAKLVIPPE